MVLTPGNGVAFQTRNQSGTLTNNTVNASGPAWVKVTRSGNNFTGYYSTDGNSWTRIGSSKSITMPSTTVVGLAVTSHNNNRLSTATFRNVLPAATRVADAHTHPDTHTDTDADADADAYPGRPACRHGDRGRRHRHRHVHHTLGRADWLRDPAPGRRHVQPL